LGVVGSRYPNQTRSDPVPTPHGVETHGKRNWGSRLPSRPAAINPDGTRVYVVNQDDNTLSVISTATNNVIATVDVGSLPNGLAINPDGTPRLCHQQR